MAEESVMRQQMETWLKKECQQAGSALLNALYSARGAFESSLDLSIPERTLTASAVIKALVPHSIARMTELPLELLTAEERKEIFELEEEINEGLKGLSEGNVLPETIVGKLAGLVSITEKYLLEKVVECQCGKPGSSGQEIGVITDTFDVAKRRLDWLYKNQFASFLLYRDSIDEAVKDKEAGKIPTTETLRPFTLDQLRSLKEYADNLYYRKSSPPGQEDKMAELRSDLDKQIDDELEATEKYKELSEKARALDMEDFAEGLKRIAEDEAKHAEILERMKREL